MKAIIDNYSKEQLAKIVSESYSMAEVATKLGYSTRSGDNRITIKKRLNEYNIDCSHFRIVKPVIRTRDEVFQNNSGASFNTVKRFFKKENIPYKCSICGQEPIWNGEPLTMILDHKNGNKYDHRLENLRYVCPNCNQQLITTGYKGYIYNENGLKIRNNSRIVNAQNFCIDCGKPISRGAKRCQDCFRATRSKVVKKDKSSGKMEYKLFFTREELKRMIRNIPFLQIGKKYNVTDNAIRRWCKKLNLPYRVKDIKKYTDEEWKKI